MGGVGAGVWVGWVQVCGWGESGMQVCGWGAGVGGVGCRCVGGGGVHE